MSLVRLFWVKPLAMNKDTEINLIGAIRQAEESDLDVLCALYFEFHEFHAAHLPAYLRSLGEPSADDRMDLSQRIKEIIQASDAAILVVEDSGHVIGFAEIYLKNPPGSNQPLHHTLAPCAPAEPLRPANIQA